MRGCVAAWPIVFATSLLPMQAGCSSQDREVKGDAHCADCEEGVAVPPNRPLRVDLTWDIWCIEHKAFDSKPNYSLCGDQAFDATFRCEGVPCTFDPPEIATGSHYPGGSANMTVTPTATGDLRILGTLKGSEDERTFAIPVGVHELDGVVIKCLVAPARDSLVCSEVDPDTKLCTHPTSKPCADAQVIDRPEGTSIGIAIYATAGGMKTHAPIEAAFTGFTPYEETSRSPDSTEPPPLVRRWRSNVQIPVTLGVEAKAGPFEGSLSTAFQ
jgi:hypothetical protein